MNELEKKKLKRLIQDCVTHSNAKFKADSALNDFCIKKYGFIPSDKDIDEILDTVMGYCGECNGMNVDEFHQLMKSEGKKHANNRPL